MRRRAKRVRTPEGASLSSAQNGAAEASRPRWFVERQGRQNDISSGERRLEDKHHAHPHSPAVLDGRR